MQGILKRPVAQNQILQGHTTGPASGSTKPLLKLHFLENLAGVLTGLLKERVRVCIPGRASKHTAIRGTGGARCLAIFRQDVFDRIGEVADLLGAVAGMNALC